MRTYVNLIVLFACATICVWSQIDVYNYKSSGIPVRSITNLECGAVFVVDNTEKIEISERVLIHQAKGMSISGLKADSGRPLNSGSCGNFEFATVSKINGDSIFLSSMPRRSFDVNSVVQIVPVISGRVINIIGRVTAEPWDGRSGGIVAIEAEDTLTIGGEISVNALGFRGGAVSEVYNECKTSTLFSSSWPSSFYGQKGEGVAQIQDSLLSGRASLANGGGGGANHNAGGGGGGNGGTGGYGGAVYGICGVEINGGLGGFVLPNDSADPRVYFGGGGGGGHANENLGSPGGSGGGIVVISAPVLVSIGSSPEINTDGESAGPAYHDGAGGGGGGGSIFFNVGQFQGNLKISAKGGRGGDVKDSYQFPHGSGGGGAGGNVLFTNLENPDEAVIQVIGGGNGVNVQYSSNPERNWYATSGMNGVQFFGCKFDFQTVKLFNPRYSDFNFVGSARLENNRIFLTDTGIFEAGAVWIKTPFNLTPTFDTRFGFTIFKGDDHSLRDGGSPGADGVALIISGDTDKKLGEVGMGIGYDKITNSIAIEFDSYLNGAFADPSASHVAIQRPSNNILRGIHLDPYLVGITWTDVPSFVADSSTYHARIRIDNGLISVWISKDSLLSEPVITMPLDVMSLLNMNQDGKIWIGLTSATGFSSEFHEINYWNFGECGSGVTTVLNSRNLSVKHLIDIYPNPSHDRAAFVSSEFLDEAVLEIHSINGELICSYAIRNTNRFEIPSVELNSGSYVVRLLFDGKIYSRLWLITH